MVKLRYKDALKINWLLGLLGQPNTFLPEHLKNKTDPFVLLKEKFDIYKKSGAVGAGKQNARVTDKREIKVSYSNLPKNERQESIFNKHLNALLSTYKARKSLLSYAKHIYLL